MKISIPAGAINAIQQARNLYVLTGAGVSDESGIPTFRAPGSGLWSNFDPTEMATRAAFRRDPALIWGWYEWRRHQVMRASPNAAHLAIADLVRCGKRLTLVTQNVDDLHERAGSTEVIHLHGSLFEPICFACARPFTGEIPINLNLEGELRDPPRCQHCNGRVRPGVIWFGEALPQPAARLAFRAANDCDCLLVIGTSGEVEPAATIPDLALKCGAIVIHVNLDVREEAKYNEFWLQGKAGRCRIT
tara:strand:- start:1365 stop:2105 length:741 start_codon:yes stop_codon:yes gene_type:complete